MTALVLQDSISQMSTHSKSYTTLITQYGDGYIQRAVDGINTEVEVWSIVFDNLSASDYATMLSFLDTVKMAGVMEWAPTSDGSPVVTKKWIIDPETDVTIVNKAGQIYDVSLTLMRVYDL